jgi:hypothetical protein
MKTEINKYYKRIDILISTGKIHNSHNTTSSAFSSSPSSSSFFFFFFFFFFYWRCSPLWALACRTTPRNFYLSITSSLYLLTPSN